MKAFASDKRGLTLIELLVAVLILGILITPLMRLFITGAGTEAKGRSLTKVTGVAQSLTEEVQALDVPLLLKDAALLSAAAGFYTKSGGSYTYVGTEAPALSAGQQQYYIGLKDYLSGGKHYDAMITLDASGAENQQQVVVANALDIALNMAEADQRAFETLQADVNRNLYSLAEPLSINKLQRSITLTVRPNGDSYRVDAAFYYSATFRQNSILFPYFNFTHTETGSGSCTPEPVEEDAPIFSVFLFYDAYYRSNLGAQTITIDNNTGEDVNVFLVNTSTATAPSDIALTVNYSYQRFENGQPVNKLVYANLPEGKVSYTARSKTASKVFTPNGYLVETQQRNRKYAVSVSIFAPGSNFSGEPILSFDSTKLAY